VTRLWSALAGIALVVALALAYLAMPSAAATRRPSALPVTQDGITIQSVTGGGTGASQPLTVVLSAPSGDSIASVTDVVLTSADGNTTIDAPDLVLANGSTSGDEPETWVTPSSLEAPPGSYTVSLTATDSAGDMFSGTVPGVTLSYLMVPTISISASTSSVIANTVDFENPTVTVSGTVSGMLDNVTEQLADTPLAISEVGTDAPSPVVIDTDGSGNFTYPMQFVPLYQSGTTVQVEVLTTAQVAGGTTSTAGPIMVAPDPIQVTANTSAPSVPTGGQITVSGTAVYQPQAGGQPDNADGVPVEIEAPGQIGNPLASGTVGYNGSYSLTFSPSATGTYDVYAGDLPEGIQAYNDALYFSGGGTSFQVAIRNPVSLASWQPSIDETNDQITASVCVSPASAATAAASMIQYAPNFGGPWLPLGTLASTQGTSPDCNVAGAPGILMSGTFPVPAAAAFYQASFPGTPSLLPGASNAVYLANSVTLANWHMAVNADGILSGSICVAPAAAAGSNLTIDYAPSNNGPWYLVGPLNLAAGYRTCLADGLPGVEVPVSRHAPYPSGWYRVSSAETRTLLPTMSSTVAVSRFLTRITNLTVDPRSLRHRGKLTISGRLWQDIRGSWKAYGDRRVEVIFEPPHSRNLYSVIARPETSRSGWFTATVTDSGTGYWAAQYLAVSDSTHYVCSTGNVLVRVG
jgi:hypothetical protein